MERVQALSIHKVRRMIGNALEMASSINHNKYWKRSSYMCMQRIAKRKCEGKTRYAIDETRTCQTTYISNCR